MLESADKRRTSLLSRCADVGVSPKFSILITEMQQLLDPVFTEVQAEFLAGALSHHVPQRCTFHPPLSFLTIYASLFGEPI